MRSRYRCYPGARLCVRGAVAVLFCELDACAEDALRGHYLDGILVLTCELVGDQIEERELTQLPYALRNRTCAYRKVRMSSVADFNWYKYTASGCGPELRTLPGRHPHL